MTVHRKINFNWSEECDKAFHLIKLKLTSLENLRHYDPNLTLILTCDASYSIRGCVI